MITTQRASVKRSKHVVNDLASDTEAYNSRKKYFPTVGTVLQITRPCVLFREPLGK